MTAGYGQAAGTGAVPPAEIPPSDVHAAAHHHQLGGYLAGRRSPSPWAEAGLRAAAAVGLFVLLIVLAMVSAAVDHGAVTAAFRAVAIGACAGIVVSIVTSIKVLLRSPESFYLYQAGLVHRHDNQVRAVTWPEVRELRPVLATKGSRAGTIDHYLLAVHRGMSIAVPLHLWQGRDPFVDQLMGLLREHGIAIR